MKSNYYQKIRLVDGNWFHDLPPHWECHRGKFLFNRLSRPVRDEDEVVTAFRDGTVTLRSNRRTEGYTFSVKEIGYQGIRKGDLVIHSMDAFAGAIGVSDSCGKSTPVYSVCTPTDSGLADPYYYAYLLRTMAANGFIESLAKGIRQRSTSFTFNEFGTLYLPTPPIEEQRAIAAFLDYKTAQIDALIAEKQRLIELLQEKRNALISHAVTKGLDPDARMKDSGVAWIGEVPEGWEVVSVKRLFANLDHKRVPLSSEERSKMQGPYPYYGASGIIDYVDDYIFEEPLILVAEDGANLYSRSTPLAFAATGRYWVNNHAHILRPEKEPFDYWVLILQTIPYDPWITGAAQPKLNQENLGSIRIPVPPKEERHRIVERLKPAITNVDAITKDVEAAIETLNEYRTALISAAVTGKIDVRESDNEIMK